MSRVAAARTIAVSLAITAATIAETAVAAPLDDAGRSAVLANVAAFQPQMDKAALDIWKFAEVGFEEKRSSALLQAQLKTAGFAVDAGVAACRPPSSHASATAAAR